MLIGIGDAPVMFFLERILRRILIGIAPLPERLDVLFALFVGLQFQEEFALVVGNDVDHVLFEPLPVRRSQLFDELLVALVVLFLGSLLICGTLPEHDRARTDSRSQYPKKDVTTNATHADTSPEEL